MNSPAAQAFPNASTRVRSRPTDRVNNLMPTHQRRRSSERLVPAIVRRTSFARFGGHFVTVTLLADIATLNHPAGQRVPPPAGSDSTPDAPWIIVIIHEKCISHQMNQRSSSSARLV